MDHEYPAEQEAYHGGLLDKFVEFTGPQTQVVLIFLTKS
jgi:hypothetical protein